MLYVKAVASTIQTMPPLMAMRYDRRALDANVFCSLDGMYLSIESNMPYQLQKSPLQEYDAGSG